MTDPRDDLPIESGVVTALSDDAITALEQGEPVRLAGLWQSIGPHGYYMIEATGEIWLCIADALYREAERGTRNYGAIHEAFVKLLGLEVAHPEEQQS